MNVRRWMTAAVLGMTLPLAPAAEAAPQPATTVPVAQYAGVRPEPQQNDQPNQDNNTSGDKGTWGLLGLFGLLGLLGLARRSPKQPKSDVVPEPRPARRPPRHEAYEDSMAGYPAANQPPTAPVDPAAQTPLNNPAIYPNATAGGYPPEQTAPPTGAAPEGRRRRF